MQFFSNPTKAEGNRCSQLQCILLYLRSWRLLFRARTGINCESPVSLLFFEISLVDEWIAPFHRGQWWNCTTVFAMTLSPKLWFTLSSSVKGSYLLYFRCVTFRKWIGHLGLRVGVTPSTERLFNTNCCIRYGGHWYIYAFGVHYARTIHIDYSIGVYGLHDFENDNDLFCGVSLALAGLLSLLYVMAVHYEGEKKTIK